MKINKVILSSNDNELYYPFWNHVSKIYKVNFGIDPVLVWVDQKEKIKNKNISEEYGQVIFEPPNLKYQIPWQTTWALFYATKYFSEDTCLIMGIDQVPLSDLFLFNLIKNLEDDTYAMLIDDAYLPNSHWRNPGGSSPSSYHVAKGNIFNKIYNFENSFEDEIHKVYQTKDAYWSVGEDKWGIDESYSCKQLRNYLNLGGNISALSQFKLLSARRLNTNNARIVEPNYNQDLLTNGYYSEAHLCRPYHQHKIYIDTLLSNISVFI